jgi:DedD protein
LDDRLKQRLVGALVLVVLAIIFLPVLFDREPIEPLDTQTQIPPAPKMVSVHSRRGQCRDARTRNVRLEK